MALTIEGTSVTPASWSAAVQTGLGSVSSGGSNVQGITKEEAKAALSDIQQTQTPQGMAQPQGIQSLKQFEQSQGQAQAEFLNTVNPSARQAAYNADQNAISLSLGLQGAEVPKETLASYAGMAALREKRAEGVVKGAPLQAGAMGGTGSDVIYRQGTFSPMSSERLGQTEKTGGGSFFLSSGELPPQNERNVGGLPQWNIPKPMEGNNIVTPQKDNGLFTPAQPSPKFEVQGASIFGGMSSVSGNEINFVAPAPLMSVEPSKSPYGYSTYYKPTQGKAVAEVFSPRDTFMVASGGTEVQYKEPKQYIGMSMLPFEDIRQESLGGKSINNVIGEARASGYILSTYKWKENGEEVIKFGQPVRDYNLLPATPSERTQRLLTPFEEAGAKANTGDIIGGLFPAAKFVNLGLPEGKKLEYKSQTVRIATDLALSGVGVVGKEGAKLTAGSYYRFAPVEFQTEKQLQEFKASPQKQAAYKQLAAGQLESGRTESAVNIGVTGGIIIGGELIGLAKIARMPAPATEADYLTANLKPGQFLPGDVKRLEYITKMGGTFSRTYKPSEPSLITGQLDRTTERGILGNTKAREIDMYSGTAQTGDIVVYSSKGSVVGQGYTAYSLNYKPSVPFETLSNSLIGKEVKLTLPQSAPASLQYGYTGIEMPVGMAKNTGAMTGMNFRIKGEVREYGFGNKIEATSSTPQAYLSQPVIPDTTTAVSRTYAAYPIETEMDVLLGKGKSLAETTTKQTGEIKLIGTRGKTWGYSGTVVKDTKLPLGKSGLIYPQYSQGIATGEIDTSFFNLGMAKMEERSIQLVNLKTNTKNFRVNGLAMYGEALDTGMTKTADVQLFVPYVQDISTVDLGGANPVAYQQAYAYGIKRGTETRFMRGYKTIMQETPMEINIAVPTQMPITIPTQVPTQVPIQIPRLFPMQLPTQMPTQMPFQVPKQTPMQLPTQLPTQMPTQMPFQVPKQTPMQLPTQMPTQMPFQVPTQTPMQLPTQMPFQVPKQTPPWKPVDGGLGSIFPDLSGGTGLGGKYKKPKGKYQPSFIATQLGIRGKPGKTELSGFAIRPIAVGKTAKAKKGKRWWE